MDYYIYSIYEYCIHVKTLLSENNYLKCKEKTEKLSTILRTL